MFRRSLSLLQVVLATAAVAFIGLPSAQASGADLSVSIATPVANIVKGGTLTYVVKVLNNGPVTSGSFTLTDTFSAGLTFVSAPAGCTVNGSAVTCNSPKLAVGATRNFVMRFSTASATCGAAVTNVASITSVGDTNPNNDTSNTVSTTVACPDYSITKSAPTSVAKGNVLSYVVKVTNNGPSVAQPFVMTDAVPTGLTFDSAPVGCTLNGSTITCSSNAHAGTSRNFILKFSTAGVACGTVVSNVASVSAAHDPNVTNDTSNTVSTTVACPDFSIKKSGPTAISKGSTLSYFIKVTNNAPSATQAFVVTDVVPSGLTLESAVGCSLNGSTVTCSSNLAAGASRNFNLKFSTASVACGTVVNNVASVSAAHDPNDTNNTSNTVTTTVACPDLSITKSGPATIAKGNILSYVVKVTNKAPSATQAFVMTDVVPAGLTLESAPGCTLSNSILLCESTVASGVSRNFVLKFSTNSATCGAVLKNVASVSIGHDPNEADNTSNTVSTTVTCATPSTGDLYITQSSTPVRSSQLLGGVLSDSILRLQLRAEGEDVDVTNLVFTAVGANASTIATNVDRLEMYEVGATTPFAVANVAGCGTSSVPANSMCSQMTSQQLVVLKATNKNILVRARMRTDTEGAQSGHAVQFVVDSVAGAKARGMQSSNVLSQNDGDSVAEGEVFIGKSSPAASVTIVGQKHQVVLSKIVSITNASPDADGTAIPTGAQRAIGQFKFSAAVANNIINGPNKFTLTDIIFKVNTTNVATDTASYKMYNKADPTNQTPCSVTVVSASQLFATCANLTSSLVNTVVDPGSDTTFVLQADVTNPKISNASSSTLQVSLQNFDSISNATFDTAASHIRWLDKDNVSSTPFLWIESSETTINSTAYADSSNPVQTGNLFITQSSTPVRSSQLLGGTLSDAIMRLQLRAEQEDIDVTNLVFTAIGSNASTVSSDVERLEIYEVGAVTPFATATIAGCGTDSVPANSMCAQMTSQQLVVVSAANKNILVRARMRRDTEGAVSGRKIQFVVGTGGAKARGVQSSNNLAANDGDTSAEGEVFIGTSAPAASASITGREHQVVLSKIVSITNASPDADGTAIPTGSQRAIGQFKFTAAAAGNTLNGSNKFTLTDIIFNVNTTNVATNSASYKMYNKADPTNKSPCSVTVVSASQLFAKCINLTLSSVHTEIDPGTDSTFVLEAEVTNSKISNASSSTLQVSLQNFDSISNATFDTAASHIRWLDKDAGSETPFLWIEYPDTSVNGTSYQG